MAASLRQTKRQVNGDKSSIAPLPSTANGSVLPEELLYEILLRLPAKPLCRLRAVCRSWRSLLSDSSFVAAHSCHHGPLVAAFKREPEGVDILDMSGQTVRQILIEDCPQYQQHANVACTNLDLLCIVGEEDLRPRVVDPATGVVSPLSNDLERLYHDGHCTSLAFGRASSAGETKVLAITAKHRKVTSCKVLTLGGGGGSGGGGEWRDTGCPPAPLAVSSRHAPLVKGVLYFCGYSNNTRTQENNYRIDHIAAYDLETETWRQDRLRFPLPIQEAIPLAELSDTLVAVYRSNQAAYPNNHVGDLSIDLWFLADSDKVLWSKRYTITMPCQGCWRPCDGHPLWVLDDGSKIVFWVRQYWRRGDGAQILVQLLRVYDTRTNTWTSSIEMPAGSEFAGVYRGSLLAGVPWIRN